MKRSILFGAVAVAAGAMLAQSVAADDVTKFYSGKTITIV